jgi:Caspase domain
MRRAIIIWLLACIILAPPQTASAEVHALVIGINDYSHAQKLDGAVADAEDIAGVLQRLGITSLVKLRDREASRAKVEQAWTALVAKAKSGDTIILTYAGHGGREPWKSASGKPETAESFLLSTFQSPKPTSGERILGKQLKVWFKTAGEAKQLRILFVADSCHAGGMMRSVDDRVGPTTYRSAPYPVPEVVVTIPARDQVEASELPHVTFIAATQAELKVPEILIDGRKRGALSYAFARALEGHADQAGRRQLTNKDLQSYITAAVRQLSMAQQTPDVTYRSGGENETVLSGIPKPPTSGLLDDSKRLTVRIDNATPDVRANLTKTLTGVEIVEKDVAALIWDAKDGTVIGASGDPVAHSISAGQLQRVIGKWRLLAMLESKVLAKPLGIALTPSDARHPIGERIAFQTVAVSYPYVTVFNLAPDGTVQPLQNEAERGARKSGEPYVQPLRVATPIGADHLVVIGSAKPLLNLHRKLQTAAQAADLANELRDALAGGDHLIGVQGLYTRAKDGTP